MQAIKILSIGKSLISFLIKMKFLLWLMVNTFGALIGINGSALQLAGIL